MTTPVDDQTNLARLQQAWSTHDAVEKEITRLSLLEILAAVKEHTRDEVMSLELTYEESAMWTIVVNRDDEGVHTLDAYDLNAEDLGGANLADRLWEVTPSFWQWMGFLLVPYTETGYVEVEKAFGMTEGAIFTPERITKPLTEEEVVKVQTEREDRLRAEALADRERLRHDWQGPNPVAQGPRA